jgi:hypothetical protein
MGMSILKAATFTIRGFFYPDFRPQLPQGFRANPNYIYTRLVSLNPFLHLHYFHHQYDPLHTGNKWTIPHPQAPTQKQIRTRQPIPGAVRSAGQK